MKSVWKYPLRIVDEQTVTMPYGAKILHAGMQRVLTIWALVDMDPEAELRSHTVRLVGTGHVAPDDAIYVGTVVDGPFVWHVFDATPVYF